MISGIKMPVVVAENLSFQDIDKWDRFYANPIITSWDQRVEEGLWRRTQNQLNKEDSGWHCEGDMRRRIVHYQHQFSIADHVDKGRCLVLIGVYLWWHACFPKGELDIYEEHIYSGLQIGRWQKLFSLGEEKMFVNGDLYLKLKRLKPPDNPYDRMAGRTFPESYEILDVVFFSSGIKKNIDFLRKPWDVLSTGVRKKDVRGNPVIDPWASVKDFFPAQVELGCGPSIEAGIPPLHFLHGVYRVTDKETGKFVMDPYKDDLIQRVVEDPKAMLVLFTEMYRRCFNAEPTSFHYILKRLYDRGHIVGPVITNNFDGLVHRVGLHEMYVRRYDEAHITPEVNFHPAARSLIVVGSHADRRRIQHAARKKGLI